MKKLSFVGILSSLLIFSTACIPDPVIPNWQAEFEAFADTSISYPQGSQPVALATGWMNGCFGAKSLEFLCCLPGHYSPGRYNIFG